MFYEWTKSTRAHLLTADEGSNKVPLQCEWISREMTESQAPNSETASNNLVLSRGKWMGHARTLLEILWHFSQVLWFDFIYPSRKEPTTFCFNSSFALSWDFLSFFFVFYRNFHSFSYYFLLHLVKLFFFKGVIIILYLSGIVKVAASGLARQIQSVTFYWWRYRHMHITHLIFWPGYANLTLHISVMADIRHISPNHTEQR